MIGSFLRKDHPLFAQRIRQAARHGCAVSAINSEVFDWAMPVAHSLVLASGAWEQALAGVVGPLIEVPVLVGLVYASLYAGARLFPGDASVPSR